MYHNENKYKTIGAVPPPPLTPGKLRLYHVEMNPYGHRVMLVLDAKKIPYEVHIVDPFHPPNWFQERNPKLKVPVLEVYTDKGDQYIHETVVICDYLDEEYTYNQLHYTDPYEKAQDRLYIERFNDFIKGSLECYDSNHAYGADLMIRTLKIFEARLKMKEGPGVNFFGGTSPGMLDYMIWPWVERVYLLRCVNQRKFEEMQSRFPYFLNWANCMQENEVVRKHASTPEEYFRYYKNARFHPQGGVI